MVRPDEPLTFDEFLDRLDIGEYDERLEEIRVHIRERKKMLCDRLARSLRPGDVLIFSDDTRPKYLRGKEIFFQEVDQDGFLKAKSPDDRSFRRYAGRSIRVAPESVYKKESQP